MYIKNAWKRFTRKPDLKDLTNAESQHSNSLQCRLWAPMETMQHVTMISPASIVIRALFIVKIWLYSNFLVGKTTELNCSNDLCNKDQVIVHFKL